MRIHITAYSYTDRKSQEAHVSYFCSGFTKRTTESPLTRLPRLLSLARTAKIILIGTYGIHKYIVKYLFYLVLIRIRSDQLVAINYKIGRKKINGYRYQYGIDITY